MFGFEQLTMESFGAREFVKTKNLAIEKCTFCEAPVAYNVLQYTLYGCFDDSAVNDQKFSLPWFMIETSCLSWHNVRHLLISVPQKPRFSVVVGVFLPSPINHLATGWREHLQERPPMKSCLVRITMFPADVPFNP